METGTRLAAVMMSVALIGAGCGKTEDKKPADNKAADKQAKPADTPKTPLVTKAEIPDWCPEHGVPESVCSRCNKDLVADFKKKGDWCKEHDVPESQCFKCHPELKDKFAADFEKKFGKKPAPVEVKK